MMSNTAKGKEARLYFIECEKLAKAKQTAPMLPDYPSALRQLASEIEKNTALQNQIKEDAPKVLLADNYLDSDGDFLIRQVAKSLDIRTRFLFDWLRERKLIMKTNEPYAEFCSRGILRPVPNVYTRPDGTTATKLTTHVTTRGVFYILKRLINEGIIKANYQPKLNFLTKEALS